MTTFLFANNAKSTLAAPINTTATSLTLSAGTGVLFPNPSGSDLFTLTLTDAATGQTYEILHCTARTGDVCTVARAQEGTTALNWATGDFANNFLTAGTAALFAQNALANPMTTKGDLIVGGVAGAPARLAVSTNGDVLTADSTAADGVSWQAPGASVTNPPVVTTDATTAHALALTEAPSTSANQGILGMSNAAGNVVTVPTNASVAFPIGTVFQIIQEGAGQTSVVGAGGVTVNNSSSNTARAQWSMLVLSKIGTDAWVLGGDCT